MTRNLANSWDHLKLINCTFQIQYCDGPPAQAWWLKDILIPVSFESKANKYQILNMGHKIEGLKQI
jgi:hypothetical protein